MPVGIIRGCEKPYGRKTCLTLNPVCVQETFPSYFMYKSTSHGASVSRITFWEQLPPGTPSPRPVSSCLGYFPPFPISITGICSWLPDNHLGCPHDHGSQIMNRNSNLPLEFGCDPAASSFEASHSHNVLTTKAAPELGPGSLSSALGSLNWGSPWLKKSGEITFCNSPSLLSLHSFTSSFLSAANPQTSRL